MTIKLNDRVIHPGEKAVSSIHLGYRPDGTSIGLPVMAMVGMNPGPVLGIVTGVHGDEYVGPETIRQLFAELDPKSLCGSIVCTPQANMQGFDAFNRVGWIDGLDMNRSFPGRADGFLAQQAAHAIVKHIIEESDYVLDLHGGGLAWALEPYVGFTLSMGEVTEKGFQLAKAFGIPNIYSSSPFPNVLRLEAYQRNIPAILVEVGGEGHCGLEELALMKRGVMNVLASLDMLASDNHLGPERQQKFKLLRAPESGEFIHSPTSGYMRGYIKVGDIVHAGQKIADIVDVFGNPLGEIISPHDGLALIVRTIPSIRIGDWVVSIVHITGECTDDDDFAELVAKGLMLE